jgi:hypothetical protein
MPREELIYAPVSATEEETWAATENIIRIMENSGPLRDSLNIIRYNGFYLKKNIRSIKTHWRCHIQNDNPAIVPEILLHGKWLQRTGFEPGDKIWVLPFSELLIVIPQGPKNIGG